MSSLLAVVAASAGSVQAQVPESGVPASPAFVVWCACASPAERARIRHGIEVVGGDVLYAYRQLHGFAVRARRPTDAAQLEQRLRAIAGVISVHPDRPLPLGSVD